MTARAIIAALVFAGVVLIVTAKWRPLWLGDTRIGIGLLLIGSSLVIVLVKLWSLI